VDARACARGSRERRLGRRRRFSGSHPSRDGPWVDVQVFESAELRKAWPELDAFEGEEYRRTIVPVYSEALDTHVLFEANIYALARTRPA
jgi:hypothetical protein